jgi:hypothetical protein
MHRRMAPRRPAGAHANQSRVVALANVELPRRARRLGVTPEAEVRIALGEQLGVDAAVRIMAGRAAFPQCRMLKDKGPGLLAMALGTGFIQACHHQAASRFEDVAAMGIVALDAVHLFLQNRVVLGKLEFRLFLAMALEARGRVFPGIDDEFASPAASCHVQACGSVARFAARLPDCASVFQVNPSMGAGGKAAGDAAMAIRASLIADETRPWNSGRRGDGSRSHGARIDQQGNDPRRTDQDCSYDDPPRFHSWLRPEHTPHGFSEQATPAVAERRHNLTQAVGWAPPQP